MAGTGFEGELFTQVYALAESQVQYYIYTGTFCNI